MNIRFLGKDLLLIGLFILIFVLPYDYIYSSMSIILATFGYILTNPFTINKNDINIFKRIDIWLLPALFFLNILSLFNSNEFDNNFGHIEKTLSFIAFPLIISKVKFSKKILKLLSISFLISVFMVFVICYTNLIMRVIENQDNISSIFNYKYSYRNLDNIITSNGIHLSIFIIVGILILSKFLLKSQRLPIKVILFLKIALLIVFIFHLGSRIAIIIIGLIIFATIFKFSNTSFKNKVFFIFFTGTLILIFAYQMPYLKMRIFDYGINIKNGKVEINENRLERWYAIIEETKGSRLIGVGPKNSQDLINSAYEKHNLNKALDFNLNAHNQYVQYFVMYGFVGLFTYIFVLAYLLYKSLKYHDLIWVGFNICWIVASLTESLMARQKSIVLISLLTCVFIKIYNETECGSINLWLRGPQRANEESLRGY